MYIYVYIYICLDLCVVECQRVCEMLYKIEFASKSYHGQAMVNDHCCIRWHHDQMCVYMYMCIYVHFGVNAKRF